MTAFVCARRKRHLWTHCPLPHSLIDIILDFEKYTDLEVLTAKMTARTFKRIRFHLTLPGKPHSYFFEAYFRNGTYDIEKGWHAGVDHMYFTCPHGLVDLLPDVPFGKSFVNLCYLPNGPLEGPFFKTLFSTWPYSIDAKKEIWSSYSAQMHQFITKSRDWMDQQNVVV